MILSRWLTTITGVKPLSARISDPCPQNIDVILATLLFSIQYDVTSSFSKNNVVSTNSNLIFDRYLKVLYVLSYLRYYSFKNVVSNLMSYTNGILRVNFFKCI